MRKRLVHRLAVALIAMAALASPVFAASPAQADVPAIVHDQLSLSPNTHCFFDRGFCGWQDSGFTGLIEGFSVPDFHSAWFYFPTALPNAFQPDSLANDSGSAIYVWSHNTGHWGCIPANEQTGDLNSNRYGYFFVTYNVPNCGSLPPGAP